MMNNNNTTKSYTLIPVVGWDAVQDMRKNPNTRYRIPGGYLYRVKNNILEIQNASGGWLEATNDIFELSEKIWCKVE